MDLCKETVQRPGTWVASRWWDQKILELAGIRSAELAEYGEGESEGEEEERWSATVSNRIYGVCSSALNKL